MNVVYLYLDWHENWCVCVCVCEVYVFMQKKIYSLG